MVTVEDVKSVVGKLESDVSAVHGVVVDLRGQMVALNAQVVALQDQLAAGSVVTEAELAELKARIESADSILVSLLPVEEVIEVIAE